MTFRSCIISMAISATLVTSAIGQALPGEGIFTNSARWLTVTPKGVLAVSAPYEFRSTDGGVNWNYLPNSRVRTDIFFQSGSVIYNIADSLFRSTDWGESW